MCNPAQCHCVVPARERLQHQTAGEHVQARTPLGFGHGDAEIPGLADHIEGIFRPPLLVVHTLRQRVKLLARETVGFVKYALLVI